MAQFATGLMGIMYIDGAEVTYITSLEISLDRDTAEQAVMGQEYKIQRVGAYGVAFSGSGLLDLEDANIFDEVNSVSTTTSNVSVYPDRTDMATYFYGNAQFSSWSTSGAPGDLWAVDFGGIFTDVVYDVGFA